MFLNLGPRRAQGQVLEIGLASISPKGEARDTGSQEKTQGGGAGLWATLAHDGGGEALIV